MTQPTQTIEGLNRENATAGGNVLSAGLDYEGQRDLEMRARGARAAAILWMVGVIRRAIAAIRSHYRLRAAEDQLRRMSDRELADLGLCRADISYAVRQTVHGVAPHFDAAAVGRFAAANQNLRDAA